LCYVVGVLRSDGFSYVVGPTSQVKVVNAAGSRKLLPLTVVSPV